MAPRSQPYRIEGELTPEKMEQIDEMFQILFDDVRNGSISINENVGDFPLTVEHGGTNNTEYTEGSVIFAGAGGTILDEDNAHLFWDDTNNRLGVGTSTPDTALHVKDGTAGNIAMVIDADIANTSSRLLRLRRASDEFPLFDFYSKSGTGNIIESANGIGALVLYTGDTFRVRYDTGSNKNHVTIAGSGAWSDSVNTEFLQLGNATQINTAIQNQGGAGRVHIKCNSLQLSPVDTQAGTFPVPVGMFEVLSNVTGTITSIFKGFAAQTADLMQWRDSAGGVLGAFSIGGNLALGTTAFPSTGTAGLVFGDGTALATMGSNTAGLFANDVAGTVEMFAINEAGTVTQLSGAGSSSGMSAAKVAARIALGV